MSQEFLAQLDSKKPIILSLNLLSKQLLSGSDPDTLDTRAQLLALNQRFDAVCEQSASWYEQLQRALAESLDFYKVIQDLFVWLDEAEAQLESYEPIDVNAPEEELQDKYKKLKVSCSTSWAGYSGIIVGYRVYTKFKLSYMNA